MSMSISPNNRPAFGCTICKEKIIPKVEKLIFENISSPLTIKVIAKDGDIEAAVEDILETRMKKSKLTHSQAARAYNAELEQKLYQRA